MKHSALSELCSLPFVVVLSLQILYQHGALDAKGQITQLGRQMARFPLDPLQSRALIESTRYGRVASVISVLSVLSASGKAFVDTHHGDRDAADEVKLRFRHRSGDHMTLLNALRAYEDVLGQSTTNQPSAHKHVHIDSEGNSRVVSKKGAREWCRANFLNERTLREALDIRRQLGECCDREKFQWKESSAAKEADNEKEVEAVLKSLLMGLWQNTAIINPDGSYRQSVGLQVHYRSSSGVRGSTIPHLHSLAF